MPPSQTVNQSVMPTTSMASGIYHKLTANNIQALWELRRDRADDLGSGAEAWRELGLLDRVVNLCHRKPRMIIVGF
jgi:hypothetical protein